MTTYMYTDKQLNELNQGPNVYSVNPEYAQRKENRTNIVSAKPDSELKKGETNTITTSDGQEFRVIATKVDSKTGFDGMAVAPIVNGLPDYKSVAVIAAGTDPKSPVNKLGPLTRDVAGAVEARQTNLSPQYKVADQFVKEIMDNPQYEVSKLSGYSQGAYMLKLGAKYHIPTTTFNAWFKYGALTEEEKQFLEKNSAMFVDYRRKNDDVVRYNDFNHPEWFTSQNDISNSIPRTIYWIDGTSHRIDEWIFDPVTGQVIGSKGGKPLVSGVYKAYADSLGRMQRYKELKTRWASNRISGAEQIYLDAVQGQILSSSMMNAARIGAEELLNLSEEANNQVSNLWSKIDFTNYTELSIEEVEAIYAGQGVTKNQYVDGFKSETNYQAAKMADSATAFEQLNGQLQEAIEKVLATDAGLAEEFKRWKKEM
ncbi:hypothetical protein ACWLOB_02755 [Streptococcus sanguinis]|uniref:hypothetical protein n=1 Tax=Streptococcus sp. SN3 TaxID=3018246 RepID=UPI00263D25BD|nr:hypothetical protein [Streptococcus sp. SN3]MDN5012504.1 hypothetical protein [Streptococcus sp. SN3]